VLCCRTARMALDNWCASSVLGCAAVVLWRLCRVVVAGVWLQGLGWAGMGASPTAAVLTSSKTGLIWTPLSWQSI
jgi:hypothetical protein